MGQVTKKITLEIEGDNIRDRQELLEEAARKPIRTLFQYDGWHVGIDGGDSLIDPDEDGDWFTRRKIDELRISNDSLAVRIHIAPTANAEAVLRILNKLCGWIAADLDKCPRCGAGSQATHHILCQEKDGTPTPLSDDQVRYAILALSKGDRQKMSNNDEVPF